MDDSMWIRDNRELIDPRYYNVKGVYGIEYETKKAFFMPYEQFVESKFSVVMQHHFAKQIVESSASKDVLAVMLFKKDANPKLYIVPTPPPLVTRSK